MRFVIAILAISATIGSFNTSHAADLDIQLVQELGRLETYDGHVSHAGYLWTAEGRMQEGDAYRVHVFSAATGDKVETIELSHSAHYLYAYGDNSVIAVGKTTDPWLTHYSVLETSAHNIQVTTTFSFPMSYQVYRFGGDGDDMFFNEPGTRSIYRFENRSLTKVGDDISMPSMMRWDEAASLLWIVESGSLGFGDEDIAYMNPTTGETSRVFDAKRNGITDIELFADLGWLVANETMTDSVLFVTTANRKLESVVKVPAGPRGLARLGKCVAVSSADAKAVSFFALDGAQPELVATWDATAAGDRLKSPRGIAVDPATGKVFLRSAYPCGSCTVTQSSVFSVMDRGEVAARCL